MSLPSIILMTLTIVPTIPMLVCMLFQYLTICMLNNCRAINNNGTRMLVIMSWDGCMILWIFISFTSLQQYVSISSFLTLSLSILVTYHIYVFLYLLNIDPMDVSKPACWKRNRSNRRAVAYHVSYLIMDEVIFLGIGLMLLS